MTGYLVFLFAFVVWRKSKASGNDQVRFAFSVMMVLMFFQLLLGIITVLYAAPWYFAILHQLGAVALWVAILRARFLSGYPPQTMLKRG